MARGPNIRGPGFYIWSYRLTSRWCAMRDADLLQRGWITYATLWKMELGRLGIWSTYRTLGEENAGEAAKLVEDLGYGAFWLGGSPRLPSVRPLLAGSERLIVA